MAEKIGNPQIAQIFAEGRQRLKNESLGSRVIAGGILASAVALLLLYSFCSEQKSILLLKYQE
jgi:hypothetical protein